MANGHRAGFSAQLAAASPFCSTTLLGRHLYRWWLHLFFISVTAFRAGGFNSVYFFLMASKRLW